jgi:peptidoglycan/LPS O-acetylase OafA/YrhL
MLLRTTAFYMTDALRDAAYFSPVGRIDQFLLGMIAGVAYNRWPLLRKRGPIAPVAVVLAGALVLFYVRQLNERGGWPVDGPFWIMWPTIEGVVWAIFLLSYLRFSTFVPRPLSRAVGAIGTISYSTYLLHFPILAALIHAKFVFRFEHSGQPELLNVALVLLPMTLGASTLTYWGIERPFYEFRRSYLGASTTTPPATMAVPATHDGPLRADVEAVGAVGGRTQVS